MKLYFLADVLTLLRIICAILILTGIFCKYPPGIILFLFAFGEITDAFDGICARKWPYPGGGQKYFWRRHIKIIEPATDISLGSAAILYIIVRINPTAGACLLALALAIGFFIQIWAYGGVFRKIATAKDTSLFKKNPKLAKKIVLLRRNVFYVGAIAVIVLTLLWATNISQTAKILLTTIAALIGIFIWIIKYDRRIEVETN